MYDKDYDQDYEDGLEVGYRIAMNLGWRAAMELESMLVDCAYRRGFAAGVSMGEKEGSE